MGSLNVFFFIVCSLFSVGELNNTTHKVGKLHHTRHNRKVSHFSMVISYAGVNTSTRDPFRDTNAVSKTMENGKLISKTIPTSRRIHYTSEIFFRMNSNDQAFNSLPSVLPTYMHRGKLYCIQKTMIP